MTESIIDADNQKAVEFTRQANAAEIAGDYKQAFDLQAQASSLLVGVVARGKKKSEERRRAKLQLRAANERQIALRECAQGTGRPPPNPLPSLSTIEREIANPPPGTALLSLVQMNLCATISETPGFQQLQQPLQASTPLLTPLLSPSLPDVTYHIYSETFFRLPNTWFYFHIKNSDKTQTLYTLSAFKKSSYQIPLCLLARTAEHHTACAAITVTPVRPPPRGLGSHIGRPLSVLTERQGVIVDKPDRFEGDWIPSRFTYGGRRFVWKDGKGLINDICSLYEVEKEWPDPKSKIGKILDQTLDRPLVWGERKFAVDKVLTIHMVGGLDQMFREFLLASQVTRQLIRLHGH